MAQLTFKDLNVGDIFYDISIPDSALSKIKLCKISDKHHLYEHLGSYIDEDGISHVCYLDMPVKRVNFQFAEIEKLVTYLAKIEKLIDSYLSANIEKLTDIANRLVQSQYDSNEQHQYSFSISEGMIVTASWNEYVCCGKFNEGSIDFPLSLLYDEEKCQQ